MSKVRVIEQAMEDNWAIYCGDSIEVTKGIPTGSVGLSVFSPPFGATIFTYSASDRDLGNCKDDKEFFKHFDFLIPELLRITMPGRTCVVHCQEVMLKKGVDGFIGRTDLPGKIIEAFERHGWIYDGRITVDKCPQAAAIRSKSKQLLFVQKERDANWLMSALADYMLRFRHPGENAVPVRGDVTNDEWILWARPVWYGIKESKTLNAAEAREAEDERHIAALQLETIERCVRLWTNPGETVFSPFMGIGSEGYVSLQHGRKFIGVELKQRWFRQAVKNLRRAKAQSGLLFDRVAPEEAEPISESDSRDESEGHGGPNLSVGTEPSDPAPLSAPSVEGSPASGVALGYVEIHGPEGRPVLLKRKPRKQIAVQQPEQEETHASPVPAVVAPAASETTTPTTIDPAPPAVEPLPVVEAAPFVAAGGVRGGVFIVDKDGNETEFTGP